MTNIHGMSDEEIEQAIKDGDIIMAEPPEHVRALCPKCQTEVTSLTLDTDADEVDTEPPAMVHPCHCMITVEDFKVMVANATPRES